MTESPTSIAALPLQRAVDRRVVINADLLHGTLSEYPIQHMGDVIDGNVVMTMAALSILGAASIAIFSVRRSSLGVNAAS